MLCDNLSLLTNVFRPFKIPLSAAEITHMKLKKYLFLFILFVIGIPNLSAQSMKFSGVVNDTVNNKPLENAIVMAVRLSDARLLGFTRTNRDGSFLLEGIAMETLELIVTHPNFDDKRYYIIGSEDNLEINIPNIILPDKATLMEEVIVYANKEPIYFRGDTLVYVADSFKRKENAVVEDLLKNLPGISVDASGNISSQGREITKVLVDGDEFFGADPTIATRNLMADGVNTIEIYETEDETSGGNSEEKIQVLDIRLKEDAKKGYFGKVSGSGGLNSELLTNSPGGRGFYEGELLTNYFNRDFKISAFGLGANTPNTGFNFRDASRFGLTNEMGGGWQSRFMGGNNNQAQGLPTSYKGGFYYSDKVGKNNKAKLGLNYTYNDNQLLVQENRTSEFFLTDTSYVTFDRRNRDIRQTSHTINFSIEQNLDSLTTLELKSNITLRGESEIQNNETDFYSQQSIRTNGTTVTNASQADGLEANVNLRLVRKFKKRNRVFEAEYQYGYSENERENLMQSEVFNLIQPTDTLQNFLLDQRRDITNKTQGHRVLLEYDEPINRKLKLNFQYKLDYFYGVQSNLTNDRSSDGVYSDFNPFFSNDFTNDRIENRAGLGMVYTNKKQTINVGTRARNVMIDNVNNFTNTTISQNVNNILPYLEYTYKFSNSQRLRLNYTTSSQQPSLNQLQPVPDNTNPNNLVIGNPDLVPNYTHSFNGFYNKWNAIEQSYIWASGFFTYTNDAFSNSILFLPDGRTISQAINVDGNFFGGIYAGGGIPLFKKILRFDPNVNITYSNFRSEIMGMENQTVNWAYSAGGMFSVRNDTIEVSLGMDVTYTDPSSSLSLGANQPFWFQSYKAEVFFELPGRFFIESDARYILNTQRAEGFNINPFIWNAKLNRRFLKTGNLVLNLAAYDILNQNVGINRSILNNVITDTRNVIIARYFMVGATLRFNNAKTKEDEGRNRWF
jgi:hypothetical protein